MFSSSKRRGNARDTSKAAKARSQQAIASAIENLETRVLMSTTITYNVTGNSDTIADVVTPAGINTFKANTLRAAVDNANTQPFPVVIQFVAANFPGGAANVITLTKGVLALGTAVQNHTWTITGNTLHPITVSGAGVTQIFNATVFSTGVSINNLTMAHGAAAAGGAVEALGKLSLSGDTFAGNAANVGGAVASILGNLTITNSTFTGNNALTAPGLGGAVYFGDFGVGVAPTVTGSTFTGNNAQDGGAIYNKSEANSTLAVSTSTFTGNTAGEGGALYNESVVGTQTTTLTSDKFTTNSAVGGVGGAVFSEFATKLAVTGSTFTSDKANTSSGGAIFDEDKTLTIATSTFTGDTADLSGGAVYFDGFGATPVLTVTSSTFTGDKALTEEGGAIYNLAPAATVATITNSTLSNDTAFGTNPTVNDGAGGAIASIGNATSSLSISGSTLSHDTAQFWRGGAVFSLDGVLSIDSSTFTGDKAVDDEGGAVYSDANKLTVSNSTFTFDSSFFSGGGIFFNGDNATVTNSTFSGDTVADNTGPYYGGGIYSDGTSLTVTGSTFSGDSAPTGGGIGSYDDTLTVTNSTFTTNSSGFGGGAIIAHNINADVEVDGSTFTGNTENNLSGGGAILTTAFSLTLNTDTFTGNTAGDVGGAVAFESGAGGGADLFISQSTFTGNSALGAGGAVYSNATDVTFIFDSTFNANSATVVTGGAVALGGDGDASIANDTFYGNSAGTQGGALVLDSTATETVTDCTIDGNSAAFGGGGGIYLTGGVVVLDGDIVAQNFATGTPGIGNDVSGAVSGASTDNIIGDNSFSNFPPGFLFGNYVGTNFAPIDPMLAPLANNGGPTQTQALLPGSLAIGNNADFPVFDQNLVDVTAVDQRGVDRPQAQGYDIGAYESVPGLNDHFVFITPATATKGVAFNVTVEALTNINIVDNTFSEPVTITSSDAAATGLPGPGTLTFVNGIATFTPTLNTVGSQTFTITDTAVGTATPPATSNPIVVSNPVVAATPTINISNASASAPLPTVSNPNPTVPMTFTVTLSAASASTITVHYGTMQGTASSQNGDYTGIPGLTLTFAPGQTSKTITVTIKKPTGPASAYPKFFYVLLTNAANAILGSATGIGTINY